MAWARFNARYGHYWPSGATTVYLPDSGVDGEGLYQVRREVLERAVSVGKAKAARAPSRQKKP